MFSGIGGFELGIEQAYVETIKRNTERGGKENTQGDKGQRFQSTQGEGAPDPTRQSGKYFGDIFDQGQPTCMGYSEIDKYAIRIYQKHFPEHKNYGDCTTIIADKLPDFDLLCGGFPCQSFSIAGKRGGFEDTRGTLFFQIARIARAKKPSYLFLENVKGLLSHDEGNTFATIISTLDELGYDCQWQVLNSKNFGVPQNRERVFIIGHLRGQSRPKVFPIGGEPKEDTRRVGREVAYCLDANYAKGTNTIKKGRRQIVQLNQPRHSNDRVYSAEGISPTLNTMQGGNRQPKIYDDYNAKWRTDENTCTLTTNTGISTPRNGQKVDDGTQIRRLTPTECERLQGFPDGWTEHGVVECYNNHSEKHIECFSEWKCLVKVSDTQRYKTLGNAVTVTVIETIMKRL